MAKYKKGGNNNPLDGLKITTSECLGDKEICALPELKKIVEESTDINIAEMTNEEILDTAKDLTHCDSESCVINKSKNILGNSKVNTILAIKFKAEGPRETNGLLNNYNIDNTLARWAVEYNFFFPCSFAMMDFDSTHEPFSTISILDVYNGNYEMELLGNTIRRKNTCFGCIVNTDYSSGGGKHWTAAFIDMRNSDCVTIEYFNSVANPPTKQITIWLERRKKELSSFFKNVKICVVTSVDHQFGDSECGLYSLFYIRRRLECTSYEFFEKDPIPDKVMKQFRKYVFRKS